MKKAVLFFLCLALTACGGGGTNSSQVGGVTVSGDADSTAAAPVADSVTVTLSTRGDLQGKLISGIQLTLKLPTGVSLNTGAGGEVTAGEIVPCGSNIRPEYQMAGFSDGAVRIVLLNSRGFGGGDFLILKCRKTPGVTVVPTDFRFTDFMAADFTPTELEVDPALTVDVN